MKKTWVQAAVDVTDYAAAEKITKMAVECGAEWIEVGHPLLTLYGLEAIEKIKKFADGRAKIVADFKTETCGDYMKEIAAAGADIAIIEAAYADFLIKAALENGEKYGVLPVFFVNTRYDMIPERAKEVADMGAKYFFLHRRSRCVINGEERVFDHIKKVKEETGAVIGVSSDDFNDALSAIDEGADWITFGRVLKEPDEEVCRRWIEGITGHTPNPI